MHLSMFLALGWSKPVKVFENCLHKMWGIKVVYLYRIGGGAGSNRGQGQDLANISSLPVYGGTGSPTTVTPPSKPIE